MTFSNRLNLAHPSVDPRRSHGRPPLTPRPAARRPDPTLLPPFVMPLLPGRTLERMCRVLRRVWREHGAGAHWVLYMHARRRRWVPLLPPQWCEAGSFGSSVPWFPPLNHPGPKLRLAGSCSTAPLGGGGDPARVVCGLPRFDGLHLLWRPGTPWLDVTAFVVTAGNAMPVALERVIDDGLEPGDRAACQNLFVRSPA